jgi:glucose-1-phosphate thymidylyltransferase
VFDKTKNLQPSTRGELEITDVQKLYINEGELAAFKFKSVFWYDCGTVQDLLDANNFMHIMEDKQCKV